MTQSLRAPLVALLFLIPALAQAGGTVPPELLGTWTRRLQEKDEPIKITIEVQPESIRCSFGQDFYSVTVEADYTVIDGNTILGLVRGPVSTKGHASKKDAAERRDARHESLEVRMFSLVFSVKDSTLAIRDFVTSDEFKEYRKVLVGKYHKTQPAVKCCSEQAPMAYRAGATIGSGQGPLTGSVIGAAAGALIGASAYRPTTNGATWQNPPPAPPQCPPPVPEP